MILKNVTTALHHITSKQTAVASHAIRLIPAASFVTQNRTALDAYLLSTPVKANAFFVVFLTVIVKNVLRLIDAHIAILMLTFLSLEFVNCALPLTMAASTVTKLQRRLDALNVNQSHTIWTSISVIFVFYLMSNASNALEKIAARPV